ncbi:efflux RND transporter permease subunit [Chitinimonas lacunae]|uniref:Efflux RND transporter permease subunit n=1 Tax=Chitinimonas lacunae TaxID=1963018 RepID=A0ABV8MJ20_9NEIS
MWFTRISIQNPVFATMMMLSLMVLGLFAYKRLPVEEFPDVKFPVVFVSVGYPGASPEIVESEIAKPLEQQLTTLAGLKKVSSSSFNGRTEVVAEFELSVDPEKALQDVREKVAMVRPGFRREIEEPIIGRYDPTQEPIISVAVSTDKMPLRQLTTRADQYLVNQFQMVRGVGSVSLVGGIKRQVRVEIDPTRLQALGIGVDQLMQALKSENQEIPLGNIEFDKTERVVQVKGRLVDAADFKRLVIARRAGSPITLEQVAQVIDGEQEQDSLALVNGKRALSLDIRKVDGANTVQVADDIHATVERLNQELKNEGISLSVLGDQSTGIRNSLKDVQKTLLEGAALTVVIVWLFLGSWRSTVITGLTLPVALVGTFFFLYLFGFSINVMTMLALSLCVGLLIDDAIVVRENIVRHAEMGKSHYQAALDGTQEIGLAVLATTLTIVAVFLPVGFMGGIIGRFFYQFGIAVCAAVLISMFVSFTLDPMLSSVWRDPHAHGMRHGGPFGRILDWFDSTMEKVADFYGRVIAWALGHRKTTLAMAAASLAGAFMLVPLIGGEFLPKADVGRLYIDFRTPIGTTLDYTSAKAQQVEAALREFPEIIEIYTTVNTGDSGGKHIGRTTLKLKDRNERVGQDVLIPRLRERLQKIAGLEIRSVRGPDGGGGGSPIFVTVQGKDLNELKRIAENVAERFGRIPGVVDVQTSLRANKPSVDVEVDRAMAAAVGLSVGQVGSALRPLIAGDVATTWKAPDGENYDVVVRLPADLRRVAADLSRLPIASNDTDPATGLPTMIPLSQVATLRESGTATLIKRSSLFRTVDIYADVAGRPVNEASADVKKVLDSIQLPSGYRFEQEGAQKDMEESFGYAMMALALGVIFIYMVLASQFRSFLQPFAIMTALPLSLIGVFLALLMWRSTLNLFSIIGVIMLMGLVTKNAILLVDFVNHLRREGMERAAAIVEAGRVRLRPILMTTFAMIFGMLPLALAMGEGAEQRAPMAHAIIGGIVTSTLLTLIVVPVVFTYLDSFGEWVKRKLAPQETVAQQAS